MATLVKATSPPRISHSVMVSSVRIAIAFTCLGFSERWFPDAFVFVAIAVVVVAAASPSALPLAVTKAFGDGFWSLIPFTMQMVFVAIGGYVVATSPPAQRLIDRSLHTGNRPGAVGFVATVSMLASLLSWGLSLIFGGLLARAGPAPGPAHGLSGCGCAAYLGLGATWALGLSSSAAQLQANAASLPKTLLPITGVIPFTETIFLWQSMVIALVADRGLGRDRGLVGAVRRGGRDRAGDLGDRPHPTSGGRLAPRQQPGEWLEHAPLLTIAAGGLALGWLVQEFPGRAPSSRSRT